MPKYKPAAVAAAALTLLLLTACGNDRTLKTGVAVYDTRDGKESYQSETPAVIRLSENTWQHISYLNTEDWGKVTCNGMIVVDKGKAIIFDTPSDDEVSAELIEWVMNSLNLKIIAVIPHNHHAACSGSCSGSGFFVADNVADRMLTKPASIAECSGVADNYGKHIRGGVGRAGIAPFRHVFHSAHFPQGGEYKIAKNVQEFPNWIYLKISPYPS